MLEDDEHGTAALDALVSIGVAAVPALTDVLAKSKNGDARRWAAVVLGEMAPKGKQAIIGPGTGMMPVMSAVFARRSLSHVSSAPLRLS